MRRFVATGLLIDDAVPLGFVDLERTGRRIDLIGNRETVLVLLDGTWGLLHDLLEHEPEGRYAVPSDLRPDDHDFDGSEDERANLTRGLEYATRGFSAICAHPPCILPASRLNDGYSLCDYHDDLLLRVSSRP